MSGQPFLTASKTLKQLSDSQIRHAEEMPSERNGYFSIGIQILSACRKWLWRRMARNVGLFRSILSPRVKPVTRWLCAQSSPNYSQHNSLLSRINIGNVLNGPPACAGASAFLSSLYLRINGSTRERCGGFIMLPENYTLHNPLHWEHSSEPWPPFQKL